MESLKELYRIGPGPSSSHTLAVRNACLYYLKRFPENHKFLVELYGSLSLTGKGHGTDKVIENTFGKENVEVLFMKEMVGTQPNTMYFYTMDDGEKNNKVVIYSVGGGAIEVEGDENLVDKNVYPQKNFSEIMQYCRENKLDLAQYVYHYEPDIRPYLTEILEQMLQCIDTGLKQTGYLPGPLHLEKVARKLYWKSYEVEKEDIKKNLQITSYAYSAMEENNCGHTVVTAPTLGSCGVVSAILYYYNQLKVPKDVLVDSLAVGGVIGNDVKTNASISGAVGGCQAEIGTACAMAAAISSYIEGLPLREIEYAAEIAMEHNLGLTCDPVGGYVQVPCIERNGMAALRSLDCMMYAKYLGSIKDNKVSFDNVIASMNYTGKKLAIELKETSLGGLATVLNIKENKNERRKER